MSPLRALLWVNFAAAGLVFLACSDKKKPDREDKTQELLGKFFNVSKGPVPSGLWLVDRESAAGLIEKKYLSGYAAKPDEMQASEIRERLKNLCIYFRIQGREIAMLTTVADSFGISAGVLTLSGKEFKAVIRGKGAPVEARIRYRAGPAETLEYEENGMVLRAGRETRPPAELIREFTERARNASGLAQY